MAPIAEDFNADELEAPEWLNAEFLTKVLCECENDEEIQVKSFKLTPGTAKGDHFASIMFRAVVDFQQKGIENSKSMIIKTMPEAEGMKKLLLEQSPIFGTEIGMYTEVIPQFEKILRQVGDETVLGARCLYHSLSPKKVIIFDDIVPQGYTVLRGREINIEEAKATYLKLAKWHAISYKLNIEQPEFFDKFRHGFMCMPSIDQSPFINGGIKFFIEMLDLVPSLTQYKSYFEAIQPNLVQSCIEGFKEYRDNPQADAYYVLCHGDFHCRNLMFKNHPESGQFEDVMLLDYQMSYVGPIANDLLYSEIMLVDEDLRTNKFDELVHYYFTNLLETLQKIGFEGRLPKLVELRKQLMQHRQFKIFLLVTMLPMWFAFREGKSEMDQMTNDTEFRRSLYQSKAYIKEIEEILPKMLHLGYFDNK